MSDLAEKTFRVGPREYRDAVCSTCGEQATYLLARMYDLTPGGELADPKCATHAAGFPLWVPPTQRTHD